MAGLDVTILLATIVVAWFLDRIRDKLEECLEVLKKIGKEVCCEFQREGAELKLTSWGLKHIGEGIREDLKDIQNEIQSKS